MPPNAVLVLCRHVARYDDLGRIRSIRMYETSIRTSRSCILHVGSLEERATPAGLSLSSLLASPLPSLTQLVPSALAEVRVDLAPRVDVRVGDLLEVKASMTLGGQDAAG